MSHSWRLALLPALLGIINGFLLTSLVASAINAKNHWKIALCGRLGEMTSTWSTSLSFRPVTELWWHIKPWSGGGTGIWAGFLGEWK